MGIIIKILYTSFTMFWDVLWPLVLGFTLSGIVQAVVSKRTLVNLLGKNSIKNISIATLFGAASSSCSYAAVALARSLFQKGATLTNAIVFQIASTNLVIELGLILFVFMGWQFTLAEFSGGIIMVILISLIFRFTLTPHLTKLAKKQAQKNVSGKMEGHASMDMSIVGNTSFFQKLISKKGFTAVSHYFVMDWMSVWTDIALGFIIAGVLTVLVPETFWKEVFLSSNPTLASIEGPLVGPLVAIFSFVCSVGNIPLAAVLWNGGISFGGVVSFIFADLIILPILDIYRKYYGIKSTIYIFIVLYISMAAAGYIVEVIFSVLHIIPKDRNLTVISKGISWNYTSWLNIFFIIVGIILVVRFLQTNGMEMLKMMGSSKKHEHH